MRQTNSTLLTFVAIVVFLFLLLDWNGKEEKTMCKDIVHVPYSIRDSFQFCRETGLVFNPIDSVWVEPTMNEKRRIRTYFKEE